MHSISSKRFGSILLGTCALASTAVAFGADPTTNPATDVQAARAAKHAQAQQQRFDKLDTNKDGVVSRDEYKADVDARFDKLDTNHDGIVNAQEIAASPATAERVKKRADGFVKRYDPSGTGNVSKADFESKQMQRFDRLSGGTGTLTAEQLAAHRGGHAKQPANGGADPDEKGDGN